MSDKKNSEIGMAPYSEESPIFLKCEKKKLLVNISFSLKTFSLIQWWIYYAVHKCVLMWSQSRRTQTAAYYHKY